jgi:hypothetical protein
MLSQTECALPLEGYLSSPFQDPSSLDEKQKEGRILLLVQSRNALLFESFGHAEAKAPIDRISLE